MYGYDLLEPGYYYLVQEKENENPVLMQVRLVTDYGVFIERYLDTVKQEWRRRTDTLFDIIELLSDDAVKEWFDIYYSNEDAYKEDDE